MYSVSAAHHVVMCHAIPTLADAHIFIYISILAHGARFKKRKKHEQFIALALEHVPQNVTGCGNINREYSIKGQGEYVDKSRTKNCHHYTGSLFSSSCPQLYLQHTISVWLIHSRFSFIL